MSLNPAVLSVPTPRPQPRVNLKNLRGKTWLEAAGEREVSAPMDRLPATIQFPADFPEPIRYDATRKLLQYRGFMPHYSFVELQKMSNELDYLTSLERIFADSAHPTDTHSSWSVWMIAIPMTIVAAMVAAWLLL
jgi:hypothetical protein